MRTYSIKELENFSGTKAHTIRIWEQRYNVLSPRRTETGIRYYNDDDLKKILAIAILLKAGYKISKVAKLSKDELNTELSKIENSKSDDETKFEKYINGLLGAGVLFNESDFYYYYNQAETQFDTLVIYEKIIYPLLVKIGTMWGKDDVNPLQEHFISNLIRLKILNAIENLPQPNEGAEELVLFLPEKETHEIGLLLANYLLKKAGYRTYYFGQQTPLINLTNFIFDKKITKAVGFVFYSQGKEKFSKQVKTMSQKCLNTTFYWGGSQVVSELIQPSEKNKTFNSIDAFKELLIK